MRIKVCAHQAKQSVSEGKEWCPGCGVLFDNDAGTANVPLVVSDPRRWVVTEPVSLPLHAERRAWEAFAAANMPFAASLVASQSPGEGEDVDFLANELAARMADRMMGEQWATRFGASAPEEESEPANGG